MELRRHLIVQQEKGQASEVICEGYQLIKKQAIERIKEVVEKAYFMAI